MIVRAELEPALGVDGLMSIMIIAISVSELPANGADPLCIQGSLSYALNVATICENATFARDPFMSFVTSMVADAV